MARPRWRPTPRAVEARGRVTAMPLARATASLGPGTVPPVFQPSGAALTRGDGACNGRLSLRAAPSAAPARRRSPALGRCRAGAAAVGGLGDLAAARADDVEPVDALAARRLALRVGGGGGEGG